MLVSFNNSNKENHKENLKKFDNMISPSENPLLDYENLDKIIEKKEINFHFDQIEKIHDKNFPFIYKKKN